MGMNLLFGLHHHSFGSGGSGNPELEAAAGMFVVSSAILISCGIALSMAAGPLLIVWAKSFRRILFGLPALDLLIYLLILILRPYPGGFSAQFRMPGVIYTVMEMAILFVLLIASPLIALLIYAVIRAIQALRKKRAANCENEGGSANVKE